MRIFLLAILSLPALASAEILEEVVVTGSYVSESPPAQRLVRRGDNLLLSVHITNDSRERDTREAEIHQTLLRAIRSAEKKPGVQVSAVTDSGFVIPLTRSNYLIDLSTGDRPDTSQAYFRVKAAIPESKGDGESQVTDLKRFVDDLEMVGRTQVYANSDAEISIINPSSYRSQVINLMAEDVKQVTGALGDDYKVVLTGIDRPVKWGRVGSVNVAIYIPYEYVVLPSTVNSLMSFPDY